MVVVTVMVVLLPADTEEGFAEQVVALAGEAQLTATLPVQPSVPATAMTKVAELPEITLAAVD